jgi:hypothetical protein
MIKTIGYEKLKRKDSEVHSREVTLTTFSGYIIYYYSRQEQDAHHRPAATEQDRNMRDTNKVAARPCASLDSNRPSRHLNKKRGKKQTKREESCRRDNVTHISSVGVSLH